MQAQRLNCFSVYFIVFLHYVASCFHRRGVLIVKFVGKLSKDPLLYPRTFSFTLIQGLTRANTAARGFIRNQT